MYRILESVDCVLAQARETWWHCLPHWVEDRHFYMEFRKMAIALMRQQQVLQKYSTRQDQRDSMTEALGDTREASMPSNLSGGFGDEGGLNIDEGSHTSKGSGDRYGSDESSNSSDETVDEGNMKIRQVVGELLPLVKHIVEFGKQCDWSHRAAVPDQDAETIKRLTFEPFVVLARLSVSIKA